MVRKNEEKVIEFYSVYETEKGGWRVWDIPNNVDAEPHILVDYRSKETAVIVAESLEHLC